MAAIFSGGDELTLRYVPDIVVQNKDLFQW